MADQRLLALLIGVEPHAGFGVPGGKLAVVRPLLEGLAVVLAEALVPLADLVITALGGLALHDPLVRPAKHRPRLRPGLLLRGLRLDHADDLLRLTVGQFMLDLHLLQQGIIGHSAACFGDMPAGIVVLPQRIAGLDQTAIGLEVRGLLLQDAEVGFPGLIILPPRLQALGQGQPALCELGELAGQLAGDVNRAVNLVLRHGEAELIEQPAGTVMVGGDELVHVGLELVPLLLAGVALEVLVPEFGGIRLDLLGLGQMLQGLLGLAPGVGQRALRQFTGELIGDPVEVFVNRIGKLLAAINLGLEQPQGAALGIGGDGGIQHALGIGGLASGAAATAPRAAPPPHRRASA